MNEVVRISEPYKLASRTFKRENTVFDVGDVRIGGDEVIVMAGPCSAETDEQVNATAAAVKRAGGKFLRGGAFKPRSSPYSFQGHGEEGLRMLRAGADQHGLKLIIGGDGRQPDPADGQATSTSTSSAPATCRTTRCCGRWARCASRCC